MLTTILNMHVRLSYAVLNCASAVLVLERSQGTILAWITGPIESEEGPRFTNSHGQRPKRTG